MKISVKAVNTILSKVEIDENSEEFDELLTSHQGRLFGFIRTLMGGEKDADEVLQITNQVILSKVGSYETGSNFRAWVFQIAKFQVLQFRAKLKKEGERLVFSEELLEAVSEVASSRDKMYTTRRKFLNVCMEKMPKRQREVLEKRYFDGMGVKDISAELGLKANAVSQLLFRGRESLLQCVEMKQQSTKDEMFLDRE